MKQILIILMINRESCSMTASPATLASGMSNNIGIFLLSGDVILVIIRYDQQHWYIFLLSWWRDTRDNLVGQLLGMALFIISEKKHSILMSAGLRDPCPQVRWVSFTSFPSLFLSPSSASNVYFWEIWRSWQIWPLWKYAKFGSLSIQTQLHFAFFSIKILK